MSNPVSVLAPGLLEHNGAPAASKITSNSQVQGAAGAIGTQADTVQFAGPSVSGSWLTGAGRVQINGAPALTAVSTGISTGAPTPTFAPAGPMSIVQTDPRIKAV